MKTVLITGGGRGLGRVTAGKLATAGCRVIVVARTAAAAEATAAEISGSNPQANIETRWVDLSSFAGIRAFAETLVAEDRPIDVLFHVAGVMQTSPSRRVSADGCEETLAVNALAPFLLTGLLLPALRQAPSARVVTVSSRLHLPGSRGESVDFDFADPQLEHGYQPDRAYKNSKLAVLWFTYELQRRLTPGSITANAVCPGFVPATAAASTDGPMRFMMTHLMPHMPFATSVASATDSLAFMALDSSLDSVGGAFFGEQHPIGSSTESHNLERAQRFWNLAADLTGFHDL